MIGRRRLSQATAASQATSAEKLERQLARELVQLERRLRACARLSQQAGAWGLAATLFDAELQCSLRRDVLQVWAKRRARRDLSDRR